MRDDPSHKIFPFYLPRTPFLDLHQRYEALMFPSEKAKPPRQVELLNPRTAGKTGVASIYLIQPVFFFFDWVTAIHYVTLRQVPKWD